MSFGELAKLKDEPVKPEIEKVDLSAQYLECLNGQSKKRWDDILDEMEEKYEGKSASFVMKLKWEEIPEGKKRIAANVLKDLPQINGMKGRPECTIIIKKAEQEVLREKNDPEYMACQNAFATEVKLEVIE